MEVNMMMMTWDDAEDDDKLLVVKGLIAVINDYEESLEALHWLVQELDGQYVHSDLMPDELKERWDWLVTDLKVWYEDRLEMQKEYGDEIE